MGAVRAYVMGLGFRIRVCVPVCDAASQWDSLLLFRLEGFSPEKDFKWAVSVDLHDCTHP
jgi:hypothetical protein